jgi:FkbM family methyltransferase
VNTVVGMSSFSGRISRALLRLAPYASVQAFEQLLRLRHEPSLMVFDDLVRPGDVVIDVGAHRGVYSDRLSRLVGDTGRVHSFEPNPDGLAVLRSVARHRRNITIHAMALSDRRGAASLLRPVVTGARVNAMSSLSNPMVEAGSHDSVSVRVGRLDDELRSEPARIVLIKIDVEGHEHEVLDGGHELIDKSRPYLVIEIEQRHRQRPLAETFEWLSNRGYQGYFLTPGGRSSLAVFKVQRDQLAYLGRQFQPGRPDPAYISDFLFLPTVRASKSACQPE